MLDAIQKIVDERLGIIIDNAKVISVSSTSCKVESLTTGKTFFKCGLNAIIDNDDQELKIEPEVGSVVLIGIIKNQAFIIQTSKVKSIKFKYEQTSFLVDAEGFEIKRNGKSLKTALNTEHSLISNLCDAVSAIVVLPGYGTTPNVAVINQIKTNVQTNNDDINEILK